MLPLQLSWRRSTTGTWFSLNFTTDNFISIAYLFCSVKIIPVIHRELFHICDYRYLWFIGEPTRIFLSRIFFFTGVSFLIVTYSSPFFSFDYLFKLHFSLPTFIPCHLLCAWWVSVCDWHSLNTISMECWDILVPTRSNACVARIDVGL